MSQVSFIFLLCQLDNVISIFKPRWLLQLYDIMSTSREEGKVEGKKVSLQVESTPPLQKFLEVSSSFYLCAGHLASQGELGNVVF